MCPRFCENISIYFRNVNITCRPQKNKTAFVKKTYQYIHLFPQNTQKFHRHPPHQKKFVPLSPSPLIIKDPNDLKDPNYLNALNDPKAPNDLNDPNDPKDLNDLK